MCRFDESKLDQDNFKLVRNNVEDLYKEALKRGESVNIPSPPGHGLESRLSAWRTFICLIVFRDMCCYNKPVTFQFESNIKVRIRISSEADVKLDSDVSKK